MMIDTSLDLRSDASGDADTHSPTMRCYHRLLWSKRLPGGAMFDLEEAGRKGSHYLRHGSDLGEFKLSSDAITNRLVKQAKRVVADIPPEQLPPHRGYTIGSAVLFPKTAPPGRMTINKARGMRRQIADRFDLTLECIRRHYRGEDSPLADRRKARINREAQRRGNRRRGRPPSSCAGRSKIDDVSRFGALNRTSER